MGVKGVELGASQGRSTSCLDRPRRTILTCDSAPRAVNLKQQIQSSKKEMNQYNQ